MENNIKNILFDFGGTLDTHGVHWSEYFWDVYHYFKIDVNKSDFRDAFVYSERYIINVINPDFNLKKTYETQLFHQFEYLKKNGFLSDISSSVIDEMSIYCKENVLKNIEKTKEILAVFQQEFNLGLISNYYGNVEHILEELNLLSFFKVIIDSKIVGFRKPDKRIFLTAFEKLNAEPGETLVIGDSYGNDIVPAKELGCFTIWLDGKGWKRPEKSDKADITLNSLDEILTTQLIKNLSKF